MSLNQIDFRMTTGLLRTSNALSELAGGSATGYQNTGYGTLPVGVILPFAGATVPTGWLLCYGQSLSRSVYAELFAVLGTQYTPAPAGTTNFNIPDLRGRVVAGRDNMGPPPAAGRLTELFLGENPNSLGAAGGYEAQATEQTSYGGDDPVSVDGSNLQPTMILNYIIKANVNVVAVP
jgi:microcystin-dependent protein